MREQKIAAPEALARHRAVGLAVDGEKHAGGAARFRHALHQHHHMAVGIGVDGARPQRLLRQRHGVEIGVVVGRRDAHRAGLHGVGDDVQITSERRAKSPAAAPALATLVHATHRGGWPPPPREQFE